MTAAAELIADLKRRVKALEGDCEEYVPSRAGGARVRNACLGLKLVHRFFKVPENYYELSLVHRAELLCSPSIHHLCKSVIVKNIAWDGSSEAGPLNAEYYALILQYSAKLDSEKLWRGIHLLLPAEKRLPKSKYSFRLATQKESDELSGFEHNAVSPVGMKVNIPVILSKAVTELSPCMIYLGGGEVDLKLQVNVEQFCKLTNAQVVDLTMPRARDEIMAIGATGKAEELSPTNQALFDKLDLRVGKIVEAMPHPDSEKLLIEVIDLGEDHPRQILSGIAKYYKPEDIQNRFVAVLCNLKAVKLGGISSHGMVMCACNPESDSLKLVEFEGGSTPVVGTRITLQNAKPQADPVSAAQMKKKKILDGVLPSLCLNDSHEATFEGIPWTLQDGNNVSNFTAKGAVLPSMVK